MTTNLSSLSNGKSSVLPGRRHSIAVGQSTPSHPGHSTRRKSIQESLQSLTQSMSVGLRIAIRASKESLELGEDLILDKLLTREMLANHYNERDIRVVKFIIHKKEERSNGEIHEIEVWTKRDGVRKKIDILVSASAEDDRETQVYNILLTNLRNYILCKKLNPRKYLCTADHFLLWNPEESLLERAEDEEISGVPSSVNNRILIQENVFGKEYRLSMLDGGGLDYEHSVLSVSKLAKFHAVSYAFRKEGKMDISSEYPWMKPRSRSKVNHQTMVRLQNIFQQSSQFGQYSSIFLNGVQEEAGEDELENFGVISHGSLNKSKVFYKYRSELESRLFCSDMIFKDLSECCYDSCLIDLLHLLFTAVDPEVREEYMADLVCSVYYDSFASAVASFNQRIVIFSRGEFVHEFERNLIEGFNAGLNLHTEEYEATLTVPDSKSSQQTYTYTDYRDCVLSMVRDILQFKINAQATVT